MRRVRFIGIATLALIALAWQTVYGQATCETYWAALAERLAAACATTPDGTACFADGSSASLAESISTDTLATDEQAATFSIAAADAPVRVALLGAATLNNLAGAAPSEVVTLVVANKSGYAVNVRSGPGTSFDAVGSFGFDAQTTADGRNEEGTWLRIATDSGTAWIALSLVRVEGDVMTLPVTDSPYSQPMQALDLVVTESEAATDAPACGALLLLAYAGERSAAMQINGAALNLKPLALVQAQVVAADPASVLLVDVLGGAADVRAAGETFTGNIADRISVALTENQAAAVPQVEANGFPLLGVAHPATALVTETPLTCFVAATDTASTFSAPDGVASDDLTTAAYVAVGQAEWEGARWLRLSDSRWVAEADVIVAGACAELPELDPSRSVVSGGGGGSSVASGANYSTALVPTTQTVWSAIVSPDQLSGTCALPPLPVCNHLVATTASGGTLVWRGQEPNPYNMTLVGDNTYVFRGRNQMNTGDITMTLTFTSATSWTMSMAQVFDADPQCTHTLNYSAAPR
jgi:uncharacterized protein YraI